MPTITRPPMSLWNVKRAMWDRIGWIPVAAMFLAAFAGLLLWRRVAGAIHEPLPAAGMLAVGLCPRALYGHRPLRRKTAICELPSPFRERGRG